MCMGSGNAINGDYLHGITVDRIIAFCFIRKCTGVTGATQRCDLCDSRSASKSHSARFLTDFWSENLNQTWWQSSTMLQVGREGPASSCGKDVASCLASIRSYFILFQGVHLQPVNLTLDLKKTFEITYIRLRCYFSYRWLSIHSSMRHPTHPCVDETTLFYL